MTGYKDLEESSTVTLSDLEKFDVSMYLDSEDKFDPSKIPQMLADTARNLKAAGIEAYKRIERERTYAEIQLACRYGISNDSV